MILNPEDNFTVQRHVMVTTQIERRGLYNKRILEAMRAVPRHEFVPADMFDRAYADQPLPIGNGQTISQPYIVALMSSLLNLKGDENVLEIGTGSGYQAAVLAYLADTVHTIERIPELAENALKVLAELGIQNVHFHFGDGSLGWSDSAPYDAIMVTAAAPKPPEPLLQQLADDGRMVIPVGSRPSQELVVIHRKDDDYAYEYMIPVSFVPLRGTHGWNENQWY